MEKISKKHWLYRLAYLFSPDWRKPDYTVSLCALIWNAIISLMFKIPLAIALILLFGSVIFAAPYFYVKHLIFGTLFWVPMYSQQIIVSIILLSVIFIVGLICLGIFLFLKFKASEMGVKVIEKRKTANSLKPKSPSMLALWYKSHKEKWCPILSIEPESEHEPDSEQDE